MARTSSSMSRGQLIISLENPLEDAISYRTIRVGCGEDYLDIELRRTLRVPSDDHIRTVPSGFGCFPTYSTEEFASKLPQSIKGGAMIPIYQREAMWISFNCIRPFAVKVFANGINIVSGKPRVPAPKKAPLMRRLSNLSSTRQVPSSFIGPAPQDYVVPPKQLWIDGLVKSDGIAGQFIASPIDGKYAVDTLFYTINAPVKIKFEVTPTKSKDMWIYVELATEMTVPRLRLEVNPKENVRQLIDEMLTKLAIPLRKVLRISFEGDAVGPFDTLQSLEASSGNTIYVYLDQQCNSDDTGIGAGTTAGRPISTSRRSPTRGLGGSHSGGVQQIIYQDFIPSFEWDTNNRIAFPVHLIRACDFKALTGLDPPPTPVNASEYAKHNIKFEEHYIEPGMTEEPPPFSEEEAGKENRRPEGDENVFESPVFQDWFLDNELGKEEIKNLRIINGI